MQLSENFSLAEMVKSQTAERKGIVNDPSPEQVANLEALCQNILQPIRDEFGSFIVSSGFRCGELSLAVGSSLRSQHCQGCAADFEVAGVDNYDLAKWCMTNLEFDQLILECYESGKPNSGWVHSSYVPEGRREVLTYHRSTGYVKGLQL